MYFKYIKKREIFMHEFVSLISNNKDKKRAMAERG